MARPLPLVCTLLLLFAAACEVDDTSNDADQDAQDLRRRRRFWLFDAGSDAAADARAPDASVADAGPAPTSPPASNAPLANVTYTASNALVPNPERGFYHHLDCSSPVSATQLTNYRTQLGDTLVMCSMRLDAFVNSPISSAALSLFQTQMDIIRTTGMKVVLRFVYNFDDSGVDAALPQLLAHIDQLAPFMAKNEDVIAVVQAGFIGSWGEWANSIHYGKYTFSAQNLTDRRTISDKLLQAVPARRMVQLRTPFFKRLNVGSEPLTAAEAFTGTPKARLAHHNDCFLASATDFGTYENIASDYAYLGADSTFLAVGGETCNIAPPRSDCPTALAELEKFHWSYLNADYHQGVIDRFRTQGCFDEIKQRLGYRLVLQSGAYSTTASPGGSFNARFVIENRGFATLYNTRDVQLVLRHRTSGAVVRVPLAVDPRRWLAGTTTSIDQTVALPTTMATGDYALLLELPDPAPALRGRAAYSIQLANDRWEAATGFNDLNHTVRVQ